MPDDMGVRVWRAYGMNSSWFRSQQDDRDAPYLAIPLDAESLTRLRERLAEANPEAWMLNAGYRMGVETTLAFLNLVGEAS